jgi:hypothetical protein
MRQVSAEDVTEQYVDLDARLKSQRQLEARLLEIIAKQAGNLDELLAVEKELSRVRQEIERMDGQLRAMQDRIALSTIEIHARESHDYLPPTEATFLGRIAQSFYGSLTVLQSAGESLIVAAVWISPWFVLVLVLFSPLWFLARRRWHKSA